MTTGQKTPTALGTEKIGKLLIQYAVPAIIAMTASSLYNMVDSIFIGHGVGRMAISGLALLTLESSVDFPTLGNPTSPTSAITFSSSCRVSSLAGWPGCAYLGTCMVLVA